MKKDTSFYEKYKKKLEEEGVEWKPVNKHNLDLIRKIEIISETIELIKETMDEENFFISKDNIDTYLFDTFIVTAKLVGCLNCGMYVIYMENASVARFYMRQLETYISGIDLFQDHEMKQTIEKNYVEVLRDEVLSFKETFIEWVKHFEKDDFEDEWNLY
ncbi:MAG: hypothetical protein JWN78_2551 [Bacteroidota bacterium]|nr:hypothetical protein [Bacteroidota bacterium]